MSLRKVSDADIWLLRSWRNESAAYFPPGPEITHAAQWTWYHQEYLERPWDHAYMVVEGSLRVGTVSIDIRSKMINRVMRGRPEGKGAMGAAICELMRLYGPGEYTLQVLEGNARAIVFYERLGFREFGRQRQNDVMMIDMRAERR